MADKDLTIAINTTADTTGAKQADAALDQVTASATNAATAAGKVTTANATMGTGMGKAGMLANQASFQVGDFFTQVEMGTSAALAFSQQAPQLIGAFQMAGLVTGPLGLALAGISVALPLVATGFSKLGGAAKETSEDMDKAMEKAREAESKANEIAEANFQRRQEAAAAVVQKWDAVAAEQQKAADNAVEADARMLQARQELNTALGKTVDLSKELAVIEQRRRALAAEQAARPAVQAANEAAAAAVAAREKADMAARRKESLASKAADKAGIVATAGAQLRDARTQLGNLPTKTDYFLGQYDFSEIADISNRKDQLAKRVSQLEKFIADMTGQKESDVKDAEAMAAKIDAAENAFQIAARAATDKAEAARIAVENAGVEMDKATALDQWNKVKEGMAERSKELTGILDTITPLNQQQQQVMDNLRTLTADGKLAADETSTLAAQSTQLVGGLQFGLSQTSANQKEVLSAINRLVDEAKRAADEMRRINQRIDQLR